MTELGIRQVLAIAALATTLCGCAFYSSEPLPSSSDLAAQPTGLPAHPLTMTDVAALAVERSPDLVGLRRKEQVSQAQAFSAGLLPDPQLNASLDHPTVKGVGLTNAYVLGLSEDLTMLLTYPTRSSAAKAQADQARLNILWDEWQTIEKTQTLFVQNTYADKKATKLSETAKLLLDQSERSGRALSEGNSTLDVAGSDLSAALDISSQSDAASRDALTDDVNLKSLLDLAPDAAITLSDVGDPPELTDATVEAALKNVAKTRPDLLALQAGYHAQEENVRTAILQQFPTFTLGGNRASDATNVKTVGVSATITLPIFGNVQANIKVQRATREQLKAEYQARLDQTEADARRTLKEIEILRAQIARLEARLPAFEHMATVGRKAYAEGNLAPATYVQLQTSSAAREAELFDLKATLWTDTIALATLLALPIEPVPQAPSGGGKTP
jgi:outer membrane protein TolC